MDDLERKFEDSSWVCKFDTWKKKKKKKKREDISYDILSHKAEDKTPDCAHNSEPDYGYKELLSRLLIMLHEDHLEVSVESPRTVMPPPQLLAQGIHTTLCLNFTHLCRTIRRKPEHVMRFLLGQVETQGFLNKLQRLEMNCLVPSHHFQAVFRLYIDAFVICSCCKSPDTFLAEDNGLFTLRCDMCGLVASIKEPNPVNDS